MTLSPQRIIELEFANYAATGPTAQATPGLELVLRDDVVLTSSTILPIADANHACLLRSTPECTNALIDEIIAYFQSKGTAAAIYVSPACSPTDLPGRLEARGFIAESEQEAWMILDDLDHYSIPVPAPHVAVRPITQDEAQVFAEVFSNAFGLPADFAPAIAALIEPSIGLKKTRHYLAFNGERPVGTCSLLLYQNIAILGSAGVIRSPRSRRAAMNLAIAAATDARQQGASTLLLQTAADTSLERLLRINGLKRAFTRTCYRLSDDKVD